VNFQPLEVFAIELFQQLEVAKPPRGTPAWQRRCGAPSSRRDMNMIGNIGAKTRTKTAATLYLLATAWTVLSMAVRPKYWPMPSRNVLARQILFTGVDAWRYMSTIAVLVGFVVVVQAQVWLKKFGFSGQLGPILVAVIVREVGPLLTNFVVLGRSGNAMATELANMKINGEVHLLDAQGIDPFIYLVIPRVIGAAVSIFCLNIIFIVMSFLSGYVCGALIGVSGGDPDTFLKSVFGAMQKADVFNVLAKSFIPGLLMGSICCIEGLGVQSSITEVPQATTRAVMRSTAALFFTCAIVSVMTYV
jgi:phospholipid/cholesterol/gamma-HCH transport system permease protein